MGNSARLLAAAGLAALAASCGRGEGDRKAPPTPPASGTPVVAAPSEPAVALSAKSERKTFRDWKASCDNGAACTAIAPSVVDGRGWLLVRIAPEPTAVPEVLIGVWTQDSEKLAATAPIALKIDGRAFRTERVADTDIPTARVVGAEALGAVRALASGRAATATAGGDVVTLSLSGGSASLLWIDERQGRLDTPGALVRVGQRTASVQPPALPQVAAAPAVAQGSFGDSGQILPKSITILPAARACLADSANPSVRDMVFSAKLGPQQELWAVPCGAGAYNISFDLYLTGPDGVGPVRAALPQADGATTASVVNARYDPDSRTLVAFNKGRGIGDCGVAQTWAWTGRAFALVLEQEMEDCIGLPPDEWPVSWRSR